jgi:hypothetical protein
MYFVQKFVENAQILLCVEQLFPFPDVYISLLKMNCKLSSSCEALGAFQWMKSKKRNEKKRTKSMKI